MILKKSDRLAKDDKCKRPGKTALVHSNFS